MISTSVVDTHARRDDKCKLFLRINRAPDNDNQQIATDWPSDKNREQQSVQHHHDYLKTFVVLLKTPGSISWIREAVKSA